MHQVLDQTWFEAIERRYGFSFDAILTEVAKVCVWSLNVKNL
jgi:hypothetical protein